MAPHINDVMLVAVVPVAVVPATMMLARPVFAISTRGTTMRLARPRARGLLCLFPARQIAHFLKRICVDGNRLFDRSAGASFARRSQQKCGRYQKGCFHALPRLNVRKYNGRARLN